MGMSAEQSILTALQRARAAPIEEAVGVSVTSGALVTNFTLAADFIMADDRVALIFPNSHERNNVLVVGREFLFPDKDAKIELEMQTRPDHQKDAEAGGQDHRGREELQCC